MLMTPTREEIPHLAAIQRSVSAGFKFLHLPDPDRGAVAAIYAERRSVHGTVETYLIRAMNEATAARFRTEDYPSGDPLWQAFGGACEVITDLLGLPPHGHPRAPTLTRRASSELWLPGAT